jgi:hypothetical protein
MQPTSGRTQFPLAIFARLVIRMLLVVSSIFNWSILFHVDLNKSLNCPTIIPKDPKIKFCWTPSSASRLETHRGWTDSGTIQIRIFHLSVSIIYKLKYDNIYDRLILPVVFCEYETWFIILWVEHRLRVFEHRLLRRIHGPGRCETNRTGKLA